MHFSLLNLFYFAFRMGPFVLVSFFVLSSFFQQDLKCIIYIAGLLFACFLGIMTGNSLSIFDLPKGSLANAHCHVLSLGEATPMSKLPLSLMVYCYTAAYLAYPVIQFNKGNSDLSLIALFPLLIMVEAMWLLTYQCFTGSSVVVAGAFATAIGFLWSWVIYNSNLKGLHTFTVMGGGQGCVRPAQTTFRCQSKSKDKLMGAELGAYNQSGLTTGGTPNSVGNGLGGGGHGGPGYGGPGMGGPPNSGGGNGNYYWYCTAITSCVDPPNITDVSNCKDLNNCFYLFDGDSTTNINSESSMPTYYRVSIPNQGDTPVLRKYINETIAESWDNDYTNSKGVNVFKHKKGHTDPSIYLMIDNAHPMYYKMPDVGTIVQFSETAELSNIMASSDQTTNQLTGSTRNAQTGAFQKTFMVQNFGIDANGDPINKLSEFASQQDIDDYKNATPKPLILNLDKVQFFQTKGCKSYDMDHCDFSGAVVPYSVYTGHCLHPITNSKFIYPIPPTYKNVPGDPFISGGKTNIYPEGTFVKCKTGGIKEKNSASQLANPPKQPNVSVPPTIYYVDGSGALNPLPSNPSDQAINYSWNTPGHDWNSPFTYENCSGIQINPQLSFNPALLPPPHGTCSGELLQICQQNQAGLNLLNYIPSLVSYSSSAGLFGEGLRHTDLSGLINSFAFTLQGALIKGIQTKSPISYNDIQSLQYLLVNGSDNIRTGFEENYYNIVKPDVDWNYFDNNKSTDKNILDITSKADNEYVLPFKNNITEFYNSAGLTEKTDWPVAPIPLNNQIQFTNNPSYCLEDLSNTMIMNICDANNANQYWSYDSVDWNLRNVGTQNCLQQQTGSGENHFTTQCDPNNPYQDILLDQQGNLKFASHQLNQVGFDCYIIADNDIFSTQNTFTCGSSSNPTATASVQVLPNTNNAT